MRYLFLALAIGMRVSRVQPTTHLTNGARRYRYS